MKVIKESLLKAIRLHVRQIRRDAKAVGVAKKLASLRDQALMHGDTYYDHPMNVTTPATGAAFAAGAAFGIVKDHATRIKELKDRLSKKKSIKEEAPTNNAGSGNIAGLGVGPQGEPGVRKTKYKRKNEQDTTVMMRRLAPIMEVKMGKFAGNDTFIVPSDIYHKAIHHKAKGKHWTKYLDEKDHHGLAIREYANKNPNKSIVLEDEKTGYLTFARYGKKR